MKCTYCESNKVFNYLTNRFECACDDEENDLLINNRNYYRKTYNNPEFCKSCQKHYKLCTCGWHPYGRGVRDPYNPHLG